MIFVKFKIQESISNFTHFAFLRNIMYTTGCMDVKSVLGFLKSRNIKANYMTVRLYRDGC